VKLSFASGSLKQLLEVSFDEKLDSEATPADDVEGLLYNFIPADYTKSSFAFDKLVESEATSFKPPGEKVGSYVRQAAAATKKTKGKGKANGTAAPVELSEDDDNAVVYEMYKVSEGRYRAHIEEHMGDARLSGVPSTDAVVHSALY
jgi:histone acetyltransferase 1